MGLLNLLKTLWKRPSGRHGRHKRLDLVTALKEDYQDLLRLAQQVRVHADMAPYPAVSERLNQIAVEKEASAGSLREKIFGFGAMVNDETGLDLFKGKNHWDRMVRDLEDQRNLEDLLRDDMIFLDQGSTEVNELLGKIVASEATHRNAFQDLLAKADPQATQS